MSIFGGADRKEFKTEYKKRFRPFSQYEYVDGHFNKRKQEAADLVSLEQPPPTPLEHHITADLTPSDPWYNEVIELRKKAGQYKVGPICVYFGKGKWYFFKIGWSIFLFTSSKSRYFRKFQLNNYR